MHLRHFILIILMVAASACSSGTTTDGGDTGGGIGCDQRKQIEIDRAEVDGYIEAKSPGRLVVFQTTVLVDGNTDIRGDEGGEQLSFDDLVIGLCVEVRGVPQGGDVLAEEIRVRTRDDS